MTAHMVETITSTLVKYREEIRGMKEAGTMMIGYARKSHTRETVSNRVRLLQQMVKTLETRSLTDCIYIFSICASNKPFAERDMPRPESMMKKLKGTQGTSQVTTDQKVCLATVDFAGLTRDHNDLYELVKQYESITAIAVDLIPSGNGVVILEREKILS
ncbi:hypothetical protein BCR43DRAFT_91356 [Syncephalastrum racemosum]|uniref:Uncharacterized protein n=1 Tax=Syncephalastrum racemosum TaxID=13706 RepID=A0A1X2H0S0_SYNRA|nr:hypothetical protein BCR43DRAFT_91356 [Syncephalastrum racemosum]